MSVHDRNFPRPDVFKYILKELKGGGGTALDVGCGNGRHSFLLVNKGYDVTCIDVQNKLIQMAELKAKGMKVDNRVKFILEDAVTYLEKSPSELFDVVIDCGTSHFIPREKQFYYTKMLMRALKKGGKLFIQVFSREDPEFPAGSNVYFTEDELKEQYGTYIKIESIETVRINMTDHYHYMINLTGRKKWVR